MLYPGLLVNTICINGSSLAFSDPCFPGTGSQKLFSGWPSSQQGLAGISWQWSLFALRSSCRPTESWHQRSTRFLLNRYTLVPCLLWWRNVCVSAAALHEEKVPDTPVEISHHEDLVGKSPFKSKWNHQSRFHMRLGWSGRFLLLHLEVRENFSYSPS